MVSRVQCVSHGVPFELQAEEEVLARMLARVPFDTRVEVGGEGNLFHLQSIGATFRLTGGDDPIEGSDLDAMLDRLAEALMVHVANFAPDRVFVHAGVVGWRGKAIVLPGPSLAGKTTLTAELVRCGAIYYSDEYAVVDEFGLVHAYARELQMREPGRPEQRGVSVDSLNGIAGTDPLAVSRVLFAEYQPAGVWAPAAVSPGLAVLELLRHTIPVQRTPARVMATMTRMVAGAEAFRSARGDARRTAEAILAALA